MGKLERLVSSVAAPGSYRIDDFDWEDLASNPAISEKFILDTLLVYPWPLDVFGKRASRMFIARFPNLWKPSDLVGNPNISDQFLRDHFSKSFVKKLYRCTPPPKREEYQHYEPIRFSKRARNYAIFNMCMSEFITIPYPGGESGMFKDFMGYLYDDEPKMDLDTEDFVDVDNTFIIRAIESNPVIITKYSSLVLESGIVDADFVERNQDLFDRSVLNYSPLMSLDIVKRDIARGSRHSWNMYFCVYDEDMDVDFVIQNQHLRWNFKRMSSNTFGELEKQRKKAAETILYKGWFPYWYNPKYAGQGKGFDRDYQRFLDNSRQCTGTADGSG